MRMINPNKDVQRADQKVHILYIPASILTPRSAISHRFQEYCRGKSGVAMSSEAFKVGKLLPEGHVSQPLLN